MKSKISFTLIILTIILSLSFLTFSTSENLNKNEVMNYSYNPPTPILLPRQKSPYWSAIAVENEKFFKLNSEQYKGKYLVMLFYPFDFTYVCPTELVAFSENIQKFKDINASVVGISTDSHFTHLAWLKTPRKSGGVGNLNFPLLADISKKISKNFQVLVEDETDDLFGASLRGLFIIDDKGIIRSITINDAAVGRSVDETLRLVQAFQHADKYGDVCPANWKPGKDTIIPDQEKKNEYFEKTFKDDI
jgi:peroxiredoxin (alkyl hydroperoxide reductase subunit C)